MTEKSRPARLLPTCIKCYAVICSGHGEGMTLEEQKSKLADARAKAQGALARGDSGEASWGLGSSLCGKGVRGVPLGMDRHGSCYWKLQTAEAFGGESRGQPMTQLTRHA